MKHVSSTLSGLAFGAAAVMVVATSVHGPGPAATTLATESWVVGVVPAYPHNINPNPHGPFYLNPYDPYAEGDPPDVTAPVIRLSPAAADPQPVHPTEHH